MNELWLKIPVVKVTPNGLDYTGVLVAKASDPEWWLELFGMTWEDVK